MYTLGIETSCDETAASVVKDGKKILSNIVVSSLLFHKKYGGVVPEIASRIQLEAISHVADSAVREAKIKLNQLNLVSVTSEPGLLGSLLVGVSFAKAVSYSLGLPLLGVNHLKGHIYANFLNGEKIVFPFIALIISGGHTSLFYAEDFNRIKILGTTQDDACGEAFDKVAKILKLGYPGGPVIEKISKKGDPGKIKFSCSNTNNPLDFSFSGIKTAVLYYVSKNDKAAADVAASFQDSVIACLIKKSFLACNLKKVKRLVVGGGVAANNRLRQMFCREAKNENIACFFPPKELCMDNAAMVAGLGYQLYKKNYISDLSISPGAL